jgi:hypothetical protein
MRKGSKFPTGLAQLDYNLVVAEVEDDWLQAGVHTFVAKMMREGCIKMAVVGEKTNCMDAVAQIQDVLGHQNKLAQYPINLHHPPRGSPTAPYRHEETLLILLCHTTVSFPVLLLSLFRDVPLSITTAMHTISIFG